MTVLLFIPCLVDQFFPSVGINLCKILQKAGVSVDYPREQTCCGQPAFNSGYHDEATQLARRFLEVFGDAETIVSPSGSCTSMVKIFYPEILRDPGLRDALQEVTSRTYEFSDFLVNVMGIKDLGVTFPHRVTYHDACHLQHAQRITEQPRRVLRTIPQLKIREIPERETCCGSAGLYNLMEPNTAKELADRKLKNILTTESDALVSGNPGCLLQITSSLKGTGRSMPVFHLVELLDASIAGKTDLGFFSD